MGDRTSAFRGLVPFEPRLVPVVGARSSSVLTSEAMVQSRDVR